MAGRILVVDDHPVNLKLLRVLLASEGFEVTTAAASDEALALARRGPFDAALIDVQLPGMDGLALTRALRGDAATRRLVIVAVTAYAMRGDEERALAAGCDAYVAKPVDTRQLPALVRRLLAERAAAAAGDRP